MISGLDLKCRKGLRFCHPAMLIARLNRFCSDSARRATNRPHPRSAPHLRCDGGLRRNARSNGQAAIVSQSIADDNAVRAFDRRSCSEGGATKCRPVKRIDLEDVGNDGAALAAGAIALNAIQKHLDFHIFKIMTPK